MRPNTGRCLGPVATGSSSERGQSSEAGRSRPWPAQVVAYAACFWPSVAWRSPGPAMPRSYGGVGREIDPIVCATSRVPGGVKCKMEVLELARRMRPSTAVTTGASAITRSEFASSEPSNRGVKIARSRRGRRQQDTGGTRVGGRPLDQKGREALRVTRHGGWAGRAR